MAGYRTTMLLAGTAIGMAVAAPRAEAQCVPAPTAFDDVVFCDGVIGGDVDLLEGDDQLDWEATLPDGNLLLGEGDDTATLTDGEIFGDVSGGPGADTITLDGTVIHGTLFGDEGDDILMLIWGSAEAVDGGAGDDQITLDGAMIVGAIAGGAGDDTLLLLSGQADSVDGGDGDDTITLDGATITTVIAGGAGSDVITISGGTVGSVDGGDDDDVIELAGGTVSGLLAGGAGDDVILLSSGFAGSVEGGTGDDTITLAGAVIGAAIDGGAGADTIQLDSGSADTVLGGEGDDVITLAGATIGTIDGEDGDDTILLSAGSAALVAGGAGDDVITLAGAVIGAIEGGEGDDRIALLAGSVGDVSGGAGGDWITLDGGTVTGTIAGDAGEDTIRLLAGTVGAVDGGADDDTILLDGAQVEGTIDGGDGDDSIDIRSGVANAVTGGAGDDWIAMSGGLVLTDLEGGDGDDVLLLSGGAVRGEVRGGAGDDRVVVSDSFDVGGVAAFDGGAGDVDTLRFERITGTLDMPVTEWARFEIGAGADMTLAGDSYTFGDTDLSPFDADGQGLVVERGGTLRQQEVAMVVFGDVGLAGRIDLADGAAGDRLLVAGDFESRGGRVALDIRDGQADRLLVTGDVAGRSTLDLRVGPGGRTAVGTGSDDGFSVAQVGGAASADSFQLAGGYVAGGPWQYRIGAFDPDASDAAGLDPLLADQGVAGFWDFRLLNTGELVPQAAGYGALASGLAALGAGSEDLLRRRARGAGDPEGLGWIAVRGGEGTIGGGLPGDNDRPSERRWLFAAGIDPLRRESEGGSAHQFGLALLTGRSDIDAGDAKTALTGWGLAGTYAFVQPGGPRLDATLQAIAWDAAFETRQRGAVGDTGGWGVVASLAAGWPVPVAAGLLVEPHVSAVWQHHALDDFTDVDGIRVSPGAMDSLRLGGGLALKATWPGGAGWADIGVSQEVLGDASIGLDGYRLAAPVGGTTATLGLGLAASLGGGLDLMLDAGHRIALDDTGEEGWHGGVTLRYAF